jgi:hypothetical protein
MEGFVSKRRDSNSVVVLVLVVSLKFMSSIGILAVPVEGTTLTEAVFLFLKAFFLASPLGRKNPCIFSGTGPSALRFVAYRIPVEALSA